MASQYANRKAVTTKTEDTVDMEARKVRSVGRKENSSRVVARIPLSLKEQLEEYVKANPGQTEQALVIRGLHSLGFTVSDTWLIDGRKLR